jgi:hypothetical protein
LFGVLLEALLAIPVDLFAAPYISVFVMAGLVPAIHMNIDIRN